MVNATELSKDQHFSCQDQFHSAKGLFEVPVKMAAARHTATDHQDLLLGISCLCVGGCQQNPESLELARLLRLARRFL